MAADADARPHVDLLDTGLLWLIHRTTFHPRGLALALDVDGDTVTGWRLLHSDEGEPFHFPPDVDTAGYQRAAATLNAALDEPTPEADRC
ncbi:hypothetical protein AB0886_27600 [Streptomyces sp. NPDC024062]|uniref:hypothetical protein n=1 Tax=unclassified Streptomyces TaxID=2593676 RepID=UPI0034490819